MKSLLISTHLLSLKAYHQNNLDLKFGSLGSVSYIHDTHPWNWLPSLKNFAPFLHCEKFKDLQFDQERGRAMKGSDT